VSRADLEIGSIVGNLLGEVFVVIFIFYGAWIHKEHVREKWLANQKVYNQELELETRYAALQALLNRYCDCVIHLGPEHEILEHNDNLAALLLHSGGSGGQTLRGRSLHSLLAHEEDKARLTEQLVRSDAVNNTVSVGIRDALGRVFKVDLTHACFRDANSERHHLLGIAESPDAQEE